MSDSDDLSAASDNSFHDSEVRMCVYLFLVSVFHKSDAM